MAKAVEAFRNIGEVSAELGVKKHVLRFWELKFPQLKPMKRGGGRRLYRPVDVELLKAIRDLLQTAGYTIKGVQKLLREGALKNEMPPPRPAAATTVPAARAKESKESGGRAALVELRRELVELRELLKKHRR